jgi:hypothetical protein
MKEKNEEYGTEGCCDEESKKSEENPQLKEGCC